MLPTLFCAMLFLFIINYMAAVLLTASTAHYISRQAGLVGELDELSVRFFRSIPASMMSMWEIALDGYVEGIHWGKVMRSFNAQRRWTISTIFFLYVSVLK